MLISRNHNNYKLNLIKNHILFVNSYNFKWFSCVCSNFVVFTPSSSSLSSFSSSSSSSPASSSSASSSSSSSAYSYNASSASSASSASAGWPSRGYVAWKQCTSMILLWFYYEFTMSKQPRVARWQAIWSKICWPSKDLQ